MKIKKAVKAFAAVMTVCVITSAMCSCTKKTSIGSTETITWYMPKAVDNITGQEAVMKEVNEYIKDKIGVTLDLKLIDKGNYSEKINVMFSAGDYFDMCMLTSNSSYVRYARDGLLVEVSDLLDKYGKDIQAKNTDLAWDMVRVDGKLYSVKNQGTYSIAKAIVFKKDLVEKYNFDYKNVKCLADLEPYLKIIKENEPNIVPMYHETEEKVDPNYIDFGAGIVFNEKEDKFQCIFDTDYYVNTWKTKYDFYHKGYIAKDAISISDPLTEKKSGKYAVMNTSGFYTEDGSKSSAQYGFPCVESFTGNTPVTTTSGARTCISSTSKSPEKAMELLNLIWADDYLSNTLAYGVEGVNYTIDEARTKEIGSKSVIPQTGNAQTWGIWHNYIGPLWDQWDSGWNRKESLEYMQEINASAPKSKTAGFNFDTEPVKAAYAKSTAAINTCASVFNIGCMDDFDSYFKSAKEELIKSDFNKVLVEINKQYSDWKKNK